jgi:3-hydroxyacyl-[acyl-carrier-protein] dehydratase
VDKVNDIENQEMKSDTEKRSLSIQEIQEIIPHRYPFLFVDRVEELEPGKRAVGYKNITMNEYFFQGHFPQEPVLPGVIMIEALAQVGAVALLSMEKFNGKIAYFGGINKAKFRRKVVPGDVLKLEVEIIKMKGPAGIGKAIATVNGEKAVVAELTFAVGEQE